MDYILMPKWITDISDIHSKLVFEFLYHKDIIENKIDMKLIREYYKKNSDTFNLLVTELSLRGFIFYSAKPNNVLPKFRMSEDEALLLVKENKGLYKNIDFEVFNLGNFLSRFGVEDDRFFNFIPLKGFTFLNPAIDMQLLEENLIGCGYEICKSGEDNDIKIEETAQDDSNCKLIQEVIGFMGKIGHKRALTYIVGITKDSIQYENSELLFMNSSETKETKYMMVKIHGVFQDYYFTTFLNFCKDNNIQYCSELNSKLLMNYRNQKGVGEGKYNKVINTLGNYIDDQNITASNFERYKYDKIIIRDDIYEIFKDLRINDIGNLYKISIPEQIKELKLKDINGKKAGFIAIEQNFNEVISMVGALNSIMLPEEMLNKFMIDDKNKEGLDILDLRFNQGKTLNEVGIRYNVTRERIRQKQIKALGKINRIFTVTKVRKILRVMNSENTFLTKEHIKCVLGETNANLLNLIARNEISGLYFSEKIQMYSFEPESYFEKIIESLRLILPEVFKFEDYHEIIWDFLYKELGEELKIDIILNILYSFEYTSYGEFFSKRKLNITDIIEIIFIHYMDKPLFLMKKDTVK